MTTKLRWKGGARMRGINETSSPQNPKSSSPAAEHQRKRQQLDLILLSLLKWSAMRPNYFEATHHQLLESRRSPHKTMTPDYCVTADSHARHFGRRQGLCPRTISPKQAKSSTCCLHAPIMFSYFRPFVAMNYYELIII
jgi:hypothetical protein